MLAGPIFGELAARALDTAEKSRVRWHGLQYERGR
jgi:hypothetical protein